MFSCIYCEIFKTPIYFDDYLRTAPSESKAEFVQCANYPECGLNLSANIFQSSCLNGCF